MDELAKQLTDTAETYRNRNEALSELRADPTIAPLQKAAEVFAAASVSAFTGKLLQAALHVSAAISDFTFEFERHANGKP